MPTSTAIQGGTFVATGGTDSVKAPCMSEIFNLIAGHSFTFQYADQNGVAVGAAVTSEALSATCFRMRVISGKYMPYTQGQVIGFFVGTVSDTVSVFPDRNPA